MLAPAPSAPSLRMQSTTHLARCARAFAGPSSVCHRPTPSAQRERSWAMTNWTTLPYENLRAYQAARELLVVVHQARIADPKLRDQALRAAKSVCLNIAEAVGRYSAADQKRVFAIARGEVCEVNSALDIAALIGECPVDKAQAGAALARGVYALLSGLIRK